MRRVMTEHAGAADAGSGGQDSGATPGRGLSWLLPALTFVAGVALGAAVVAVGNVGGGDDDPGADPAPTVAARDGEQDPEPRSSDLLVTVPAACLATADGAESVGRSVDDLVQAAGELDARRLQELVDRFQQLQPEIERAARECRRAAAAEFQDGTLVTPSPVPSPS